MTSTTTEKATENAKGGDHGKSARDTSAKNSALVTDKGTTTIADTVVQKIAGLAAREVRGVHALGGGAARAFGALRDRIPGASASVGQGVSVEVGEKQAAVDLDLVVEYGVAIAELARAVRRNVVTAIEQMTGLEVVEVNINVNDVYIEDYDDEEQQSGRDRVQ
ncbi:Asp23/Gls24 family envelope stress response protein [Nocardia transvalensis]|uniref:Asp23/Gls24 family envelope stress response protein n=1 Tax=Nocardia transvalensis TaxID=37333 RepID=UPI0018937379|nr:Asp23/Gls24 family envelope stress response protein [Nocardia transvalensis]MBF6326914.1 Asp23/Gls24 family envelope stress response protein [Nocardia transvalensis]